MRMTRALVPVVVILVSLVACLNLEDPAPSNQSQLVVHAILDVHAEVQVILLHRARTGEHAANISGISDDEPISDAVITVIAPNGTAMTATEKPPSADYRYFPGLYRFVPSASGITLTQGATYTLRVRTPTGEDVTGTTTIPLVLTGETTLPPRTFFRLQDTLRLSLPPLQGAQNYELILRVHGQPDYWTFTDSTVMVPGTALTIDGYMIFPLGRRVEVAVSAVDANYYDYYRTQSDPFAGPAPSHLTGAVGVFGSTVPILMTALRVR
jgi:Domain of unknown function (DUF4249)